ncbi:YolD-like family protein [Virgibacillus flavescens]|uniref:YolD-like family protein n=1 Tax=Virgibacillus flavescens TaxID=1611422 RepID=UPI003D3491C7
MSVNDRGTKKWTAMMLPEHIELLKKMWQEEEYKEKPILDEQQLMEMETKLQCALHNNLTVEIKHYDEPHFAVARGKLLKINARSGYLRVGEKEISLENVLDVYID